jgi:hypothetical protein
LSGHAQWRQACGDNESQRKAAEERLETTQVGSAQLLVVASAVALSIPALARSCVELCLVLELLAQSVRAQCFGFVDSELRAVALTPLVFVIQGELKSAQLELKSARELLARAQSLDSGLQSELATLRLTADQLAVSLLVCVPECLRCGIRLPSRFRQSNGFEVIPDCVCFRCTGGHEAAAAAAPARAGRAQAVLRGG